MRVFFRAFFRHWRTIFSQLISSVTASCCACSVVTRMFPFFNVARPGQLSPTHFKYFTSFFRAVPDVQLSIMFIFESSIARQRINIRHYVYCLAVLRTLSCPIAGMYLCRREFIARPTLPALSLHALFTLALFTCRFHYPRNPYDVLYTLFPVPAQSIPPKWPLPAVSLHTH